MRCKSLPVIGVSLLDKTYETSGSGSTFYWNPLNHIDFFKFFDVFSSKITFYCNIKEAEAAGFKENQFLKDLKELSNQ